MVCHHLGHRDCTGSVLQTRAGEMTFLCAWWGAEVAMDYMASIFSKGATRGVNCP